MSHLLRLTAALFLLPATFGLAPAFAAEKDPSLNKPPAGFVDLTERVPGIRLEIRYHTARNFSGAPLPGYGVEGAWMLEQPAEALAAVQAELAKKGLGLLVYDAYRPLRGTLGMAAWAERTGQAFLLNNGYIARRSGHNHGHTIDLTIADLATGKPLDMGTDFDTLSPAAHTMNAKGKQLENRLLLKSVMEAHGFVAYRKEWWHFGFPIKGTRSRDVPYGCFEPREGKWVAPKGCDQPGFEMPREVVRGPCAR
jgi:D-alanyl-D-alanine dipeptidase